MAKISVSLDDALLDSIRDEAPKGNVSGWIADAAEQKLRRDAMRRYADDIEAETGPFTEAELESARAWLSSATRQS